MTKQRIARMALAVNPQRGPMLEWGIKSGSMFESPADRKEISFTPTEVY
jgi:hypothetical protein